MNLPKAVYDKGAPTGNLISTIMGVVALVVPILAIVGLITPEQSSALQQQLGIVGTSVTGIIGAVYAIILIFKTKDA